MRIVVVDGSVAGIAACQALRAEGWDGEIIVVSDEVTSYDRPPLSKSVLLGTTRPASSNSPTNGRSAGSVSIDGRQLAQKTLSSNAAF